MLIADFSRVTKKSLAAQKSFQRSTRKLGRYYTLMTTLRQDELFNRVEKAYQVGTDLSSSLVHVGEAVNMLAQIGQIILSDQPAEINPLINDAGVSLDRAYERLSLAEAAVRVEKDLLPVEIPFDEIRPLLLKTSESLTILPEIIGLGERRVYLVLLQNNMELRPTGGFIGSFALVTFMDGHLIDLEVQDVYAADGQLKGHVEPPEPIKKYLGEAAWFLRDSNWHPDFVESAIRAEWFFKKETGRNIDGVVGINLHLIQNVLEEVGELQLPDYQDKINHVNLFERAEYFSETNFFPGSTQKKDFLASLIRSLFEKIRSGSKTTWLSLGKAVYLSLMEKDAMIYLHDPQAMEIVSEMEWDGRVRGIECQSAQDGCLTDYLMLVEANLGVNKANYFMDRSISRHVDFDQAGEVSSVVTINYENFSQSESFPAGSYKNYLRVLVPRSAVLDRVLIDDQEINKKEIDQEIISDKKSFGFLIEVPIRQKRKVTIHYRLTDKLDFDQQALYIFLLQKQSGIKDDQFNLLITAPEETSFFNVEPRASFGSSSLIFSPVFDQDLVFEAKMIR